MHHTFTLKRSLYLNGINLNNIGFCMDRLLSSPSFKYSCRETNHEPIPSHSHRPRCRFQVVRHFKSEDIKEIFILKCPECKYKTLTTTQIFFFRFIMPCLYSAVSEFLYLHDFTEKKGKRQGPFRRKYSWK